MTDTASYNAGWERGNKSAEIEINRLCAENQQLRADNTRLRELLTDTVASMERGGFHTDLQRRIRHTLAPKP